MVANYTRTAKTYKKKVEDCCEGVGNLGGMEELNNLKSMRSFSSVKGK